MTQKVRPSTLADTSVTAGTYGGSTQHGVFTVDAQGRLTYAANATPSIANTQITGKLVSSQIDNITPAQIAGLTGEIKMWPKSTAPSGYLICDGSTVSRTTYAALFSVIGTAFGGGDGSTTFALPNFSGRTPLGVSERDDVANTGGSFTSTLTTTNLPSHGHTFSGTLNASTGAAGSHYHGFGNENIGNNSGNFIYGAWSQTAPGGNVFWNGSGSSSPTGGNMSSGNLITSYPINAGSSGEHTHSLSGSFSGTSGSVGSGTAFNTVSPYLAIYYIIRHV